MSAAVLVAPSADPRRSGHVRSRATLWRSESHGGVASPAAAPITPPDSPTARREKAAAAPPAAESRFSARASLLSRGELTAGRTPKVHGLVALFWIASALYAFGPVGHDPAALAHVLSLRVLSECYTMPMAMAGHALFSFLYAYAVWAFGRYGLARLRARLPYSVRFMLRHSVQSVPLAVTLVSVRQWMHLQRGTSLIYAIGLMMKSHAYLASVDAGAKPPTIAHFTRYLLYPTLLYEASYPQMAVRSLGAFVEHSLCAGIASLLLYGVVETRVYPVLRELKRDSSPVASIAALALPTLACSLLVFVLVFEHGLNALAELTAFADRRFYDDWWNAEDMGAFARKWNVPVHRFLQRHVFLASMERLSWRRSRAVFFTFFYSAVLHELVLSVSIGRLRLYIFVLQMSQLPLMWAAQRSGLARHPFASAAVWWAMIAAGLPLLTYLYAREVV